MKSKDNVACILDCLKKQANCYQQLVALAERQKTAIESDDDPSLFQLVNDKNDRVVSLHELDREISERVGTLTEAERQNLIDRGEPLRARIAKLLETLIRIEENCTQALTAKKLETLEQLKEFKQRKKGLKGYGSF